MSCHTCRTNQYPIAFNTITYVNGNFFLSECCECKQKYLYFLGILDDRSDENLPKNFFFTIELNTEYLIEV